MLNKDLVDAIILLISLLATTVFCFRQYRHPAFCQKKGFTFFLTFLAMYPLLSMLGHVIAIGTFALINVSNGAFTYDFRFYSLMFYGIVFMLLNGYLLNLLVQFSRGHWQVCGQLHSLSLLQILLILPSFWLNPMALMPAVASLLLMGRLYWAQKRKSRQQPTYISAQAA